MRKPIASRFPQWCYVLWYMETGERLTKIEALNRFGCGNLGDVVYKLRKKGYDIRKEWKENVSRFGKKRFAEYYLHVKECDCAARCSCECSCGSWDGVECEC